jgi:hypothetical protein
VIDFAGIAASAIGWKFKLAAALLIAAALGGLYAWRVHVERDVGREEIRGEWAVANAKQTEADLAQSEINAKETLHRLQRQQENQHVQDLEMAAARAAAVRNGRDADQLREQNAAGARRWGAALRDSPTLDQCAAGGDAIGVLADVLGRADRRAGQLAEVADTARSRGLKCERDYDALTEPPHGPVAPRSPP